MSPTLQDCLQLALELRWCEQKTQERTYARARSVVRILGPDTPLADIKPGDLKRAAKVLIASGLTGATVNRYIAAFRGALRVAYEEGWVALVPPFRAYQETGARDRVPTRQEVSRILLALRSLDPLAARFCRWLWRTGMRRGEALGLVGSDIEDESWALLTDTKNGRPRRVPLPPGMRSFAALRCRKFPPKKLFPLSPSGFQRTWVKARQEANLGEWFVPHTLRHGRATELIRSGVPIPVVAAFLGHSSWQTTQRYTHPGMSDLEKAAAMSR